MRNMMTVFSLLICVLSVSRLRAQSDSSPHRVRFVTVQPGVRLEVLDWGGSGRPVVLLAGGANTPHDFDQFALRLTATYHVYGITRRGFGASSRPDSGYESDRLGDDVLAVIDSLRIRRPTLVGHSRAGEELSSIGSRHPEMIAGLVYLDAGYYYAYYDSVRGNPGLDMLYLQRKLQRFLWGPAMTRRLQDSLIREALDHDLPMVEKGLRATLVDLASVPDTTLLRQPAPTQGTVLRKIWEGTQKYSSIRAPMLAIYCDIGPPGEASPADEFKQVFPSARVVRLRQCEHNVYASNEAEVLREVRAFIGATPE